MIEIKTLVLSPLDTNCYIVKTGDKTGVVIDPADKSDKILEEADKMGITIEKILLTHGHFDHFSAAYEILYGGAKAIKKAMQDKAKKDAKEKEKNADFEPEPFDIEKEMVKANISIYIHEQDACMLSDANKSLAYFCPSLPFKAVKPDVLLKDGDKIASDTATFEVMHTPGHSAGSVCYILKGEDKNIMFAGDTIFYGSIGRSDGYSGDYIVQQVTLDKLKNLEDDYIILSGHGPSTTLFEEKKYNPFIK